MTPRTPVQIAPTFVVATRPEVKAGSPVCSLECLGKWQLRLKQPLLLGIGSPKNRHCSHCSICAIAIRVPEQCAIHDIYCPHMYWEGTVSAAEAVAELARIKPGPISDKDFNYLLFLLRNYPETHPDEIAMEVVQAAEDSCADEPHTDGTE